MTSTIVYIPTRCRTGKIGLFNARPTQSRATSPRTPAILRAALATKPATLPTLRSGVAAALTACIGLGMAGSAIGQTYDPAHRHFQPNWTYQQPQVIQPNAGATQMYPNGAAQQIPNVAPPTWFPPQPNAGPYLDPRYYRTPEPVQPISPFVWRIYR